MIKEKRILIVTSEFPPQPGGIGNHAHHLAKHLQNHHFDVQVICDNRSFSGEEEKLFDETLNFRVHRISRQHQRFFMYLKRIKCLFKLIKGVDIVIASGKFSLWIVAFFSLFYKKDFVAVVHGTEVNFRKAILKATIDLSLKRFTTIIAVSKYTKSLISHLKHKRICVIPNGFDAESWIPGTTVPIDLPGYLKLITVGNLTERKGQLNVIRHLPELLKVYPKLHYHCVGIPTEQNRFMQVAKELEVKDHVTFHGQVSHERLRELMVSCDVFVMLSSPTASGDVEGFGISILEANALGLPAIGSLGCGIADAINLGVSGFLIPHNDSASFLDSLKQLLKNTSGFKLGAQEWAKGFDWKHIIKRYIEVLQL